MIQRLNKTLVWFVSLGPVARSLVSANRWLRGIKMYRFPWCFTLVSTNHASSNPGHIGNFTPRIDEKKKQCRKGKNIIYWPRQERDT